MNIAVCDDEKIIREQITNLIGKQKVDFHVETYDTGDALLAAGKHFDVVFLDIQMEGRNGIETARMIRKWEEDFVLIFITGVKEYVFEAFDVAAFHYLLKPIQEEKFTEVFERAVVEIHTTGENIEIYAVMSELEKQLGSGFYRCHRGYLVNMAHITEYDSDSISMNNGESIYLAKERYSGFVKEYMRYLRSGGAAGV